MCLENWSSNEYVSYFQTDKTCFSPYNAYKEINCISTESEFLILLQ